MPTLLERFLGVFSLDMGIDLGTANTAVCVGGQGIVLCEPSVVAVRKGTTEVLNNGAAIAQGPAREAIADPQVVEAYIGKARHAA